MLTPPGMGDGMASGAFKDLTPLVGLDGRLEWEGLLQSVRTSALLYKNRVSKNTGIKRRPLRVAPGRVPCGARASTVCRARAVQVVGLPLSAWSSLLYFRQDVFDRNNIPVPQTW